jgi:hypothetical protein
MGGFVLQVLQWHEQINKNKKLSSEALTVFLSRIIRNVFSSMASLQNGYHWFKHFYLRVSSFGYSQAISRHVLIVQHDRLSRQSNIIDP